MPVANGDEVLRFAQDDRSERERSMTPGKGIFHPDFKAAPWWWEAWTPNNALSQDPPARTDVVIVGAGYGGLSTALELRRNGVGAVVLERVRAWPDKRHLPEEDIQQLRQLVDVPAAQQPSDGGDPHIVLGRLLELAMRGRDRHAAELEDQERLLIEAVAALHEEHRSSRIDLDQ